MRGGGVGGERLEAFDGAFQKNIVPAGDVESRDVDLVDGFADVLRFPIIARHRMIEPIQNVAWQGLAVERGIISDRKYCVLRREIAPGFFQAVPALAEFFAAGVSFQHLEAPAKSCSQSERTVFVEPAMIEIVRGHCWRNAFE